ncbi:MAG: outer membrane beta-barrel protein [Acidobacteriia bacterium]|nr:outer membrane beta-barrel protein [Terriglobia bacterium]
MKRVFRFLSLPVLLLCCFQFANAQSLIDFNIGFGAAQNKASTTGIDQLTFGSCTPGPGCSTTSKLSSFFLGVGANLMLWKHAGFGMDATLQPGKPTYAQIPGNAAVGFGPTTIQSRVTFYDFNGIYQPVNTKKATLQLVGGFGGANTRFYTNYVASGSPLGSSNFSQYASSANHFQVHGGVGVQIYVTDKVFVRPQIDIRYVPNFTEQFGRNSVFQEMVWVGYTIGDRQ